MSKSLYAESLERRDKLQIYADVLKVSYKETKMTRILRLANIQYNTFNECIDKLCEAGLLEKVDMLNDERTSQDNRSKYEYKVTEMGTKWLDLVDDIYRTLDAPRARN